MRLIKPQSLYRGRLYLHMLLLDQLLMFDHGHAFRRLLKFGTRKSLAQLSMRLVELLGYYQQIKHWLVGRPAETP